MVKDKEDKLASAFIEEYNNSEKIYSHHVNLDYKQNPFVGYTLKKLKKEINNEVVLQTNEIGLRCPELDLIKSCDVILLGGSAIYSVFAASEKATIHKLVEEISNKKVINCGVPGHVFKQHLSLYFNYLKNIKSKNIIIMFGFNDMVNCFMGRNYAGILNENFANKVQRLYDHPFSSSIKIILITILDFIGLKKYMYNKSLKKKVLKRNESIDNINDLIDNYLSDIEKDIFFFNNYCEKFDIKLHLILQPSLYVTKKKFSNYERRRFNEWTSIPKRQIYATNFYEKIDHLLSKFNNYHNFSDCFDSEVDTIFIDECHYGDRGSIIVSKLINNILK